MALKVQHVERGFAFAILGLAPAALMLLASPASAQSAPERDPVSDLVGGSQSAPPSGASSASPVRLPPPVMSADSKRRFDIVSSVEVHGAGRDTSRTNRQTIELQVMPRKGKARVIRYVIRSGEIGDDPLAQAMLNASKGLATDFEADANGRPLRLSDWTGVRVAMLKGLIADPAAPVAGVQHVQQVLNAMDPVSAIPFAIPETLMMSDMQGWAPQPAGRRDDPAATVGAGSQQGRLVSWREIGAVDPASCTARLVRSTMLDPASPAAKGGKEADSLETTAEVSTVDGWVVRLTQTKSHKSPAGSEVRTWTLTRQDPPACKG